MKQVISNPLVMLALTLVVYFFAAKLQQKFKIAILSPIIITMAVVISYLLIFNIEYSQYEQASTYIDFWLKPSVVALGVPLYLQFEKIKKQIIPLLFSQFIGCLVGIISVCLIAKLLGADRQIILSLAPKSVTTPIAIEIANVIGGEAALTAAVVILTGMTGMLLGFHILRLLKIHSPIAQGISLGTSAHGMGIIAATRLSDNYATYASLGLIFNGLFTAFLTPYVIWIMELLNWI